MIFCCQFKCRKELILFCIYFHFPPSIRNEYQVKHILGCMINSWSWSWAAPPQHQLENFIMWCCHAEQQWYWELVLASLKGLEYKSLDVVERVIIIWNTLKLNTSLSLFVRLINSCILHFRVDIYSNCYNCRVYVGSAVAKSPVPVATPVLTPCWHYTK